MADTKPPVFFDPTRRRWRRVQTLGILMASLAVLALGLLGLDLEKDLPLPSLALPLHRPLLRPPRSPLREYRSESGQLRGLPPVPSGRPRSRPLLRMAFLVDWDDNSFASLKANGRNLDEVLPEWLHLAGGVQSLREDDPGRRKEMTRWMRRHAPRLRILPLVNNYLPGKGWDGRLLLRELRSPVQRGRLVRSLGTFVSRGGYEGLCVDFEGLPREGNRDFLRFLRQLRGCRELRGRTLVVAVPLDDPAYLYGEIARACDFLLLMAYDEHWAGAEPGPLASWSWVGRGLRLRVGEVSPDHLVVALGNYGYDWNEKDRTFQELTFQDALRTARESQAFPLLDPKSLNPVFSYQDEEGAPHRVWYLDGVTLCNQILQVREVGAAGVALWRLGSEDPGCWSVLAPGAKGALGLNRLRAGYDLDYEGRGEILRVASVPRDGWRSLRLDGAGRVVREEIRSFPLPYEIDRWGYRPRKVVLTFDDGPDPRITPRILDILRREGVRGVFFLVGQNANLYPDLVRRELREGHLVGNHTFFHPDISRLGPRGIRWELNLFQRLLESRFGVSTLLFRPPYGEDVEPVTPEEIRPLQETSRRGYLTVGMGIDPGDWKRPGAEEIVRRVVAQAERGRGSVILLHDGGGDRRQTVEALPGILRALRARGIVPVSLEELLGVSRDRLMPPPAASESWPNRLAAFGFGGWAWAVRLLAWFFLGGIVLGIGRTLAVTLLALIQKGRSLRRPVSPPDLPLPSLALVVPCYNEERVIRRTLERFREADLPGLEILVVDDGSTDGTDRAILEAAREDPRVRLLRKENGGKASALNLALASTEAEVVVTVDADTRLDPQGLSFLRERFVDPDVGAVAGNAKVGNRRNLLTRWQALEYVASQNLDRRAFEVLEALPVVPGAVGAWRRRALLEVGGFPPETLAEDADATLTLLRRGWKVRYEDRAVAWTEAPETPKAFLKQRFRWAFGTLQVLWKHRKGFFRWGNPGVGWGLLPDSLFFRVLLPALAPLGDLYALGVLLWTSWAYLQHPASATLGPLGVVGAYLGVFLLLETASAATAFLLERDEDPCLLLWIPLQRFSYRQLLYWVCLKSLLSALKGSLVGWNKLERLGNWELLPRKR